MTPTTDEARPRPAAKRYRGQTAQQRQQVRRERLVEAGIELFGTIGYHETSIRAVLREAGLGERYFYESFDSLESLLIAAGETVQLRIKQAVVDAIAGVETPSFESLLQAAFTAVGRVLEADPRVMRIALIETICVSPRVTARRNELMGDFVELIVAAGTAFSEIAPDTGHIESLGLLGAANELLMRWASGQLDADLATVIEHIEVIFAGTFALSAERAARRAGS
ncbi:MAG: TetR/AcrR family transcriptional regulator [Actinobacteria bacterium]|nr:TetR/AcrR family transcriptional regulator [Actinomycetota bacterium]